MIPFQGRDEVLAPKAGFWPYIQIRSILSHYQSRFYRFNGDLAQY